MEKKVFAFAMVMGMGVSAFAQEVKTDSTAVDTVAVENTVAAVEVADSVINDSTVAFYLPTDSTVNDSTMAMYEPTDSTVTDSTKTCVEKAELASVNMKKYAGAAYGKAVVTDDDDAKVAIMRKENELA